MAKTATEKTLSPFLFTPERGIHYQDLRDIAEMQNYANLNAYHTLVAASSQDLSGTDTPTAGDLTDGVKFDTGTAIKSNVYRFSLYIDQDVSGTGAIGFTSVCNCSGSAQGEVKFLMGGVQVGFNHHTAAGTSELTSTGTRPEGWYDCEIQLRRSSADNSLIRLWHWMVYVTPPSLVDPDSTW